MVLTAAWVHFNWEGMSKRTQYLQGDGSRKYNAPLNPPGACAVARVFLSELLKIISREYIGQARVLRRLLASSIIYILIDYDRLGKL